MAGESEPCTHYYVFLYWSLLGLPLRLPLVASSLAAVPWWCQVDMALFNARQQKIDRQLRPFFSCFSGAIFYSFLAWSWTRGGNCNSPCEFPQNLLFAGRIPGFLGNKPNIAGKRSCFGCISVQPLAKQSTSMVGVRYRFQAKKVTTELLPLRLNIASGAYGHAVPPTTRFLLLLVISGGNLSPPRLFLGGAVARELFGH